MPKGADLSKYHILILIFSVAVTITSSTTFSLSENLKDYETYLNSTKTLAANFIQISDSGKVETGSLKLKKPGKLLLEYNLPSRHVVVADNGILVIIDKQSNTEPLRYLISNTPLELLSKTILDFKESKLNIIKTIDSEGVHLEFFKKDNLNFGRLVLTFKNNPIILTKWRTINKNGSTVTVLLEDLKTNQVMDDSVFYIAPRILELNLNNK